jgi:hypothetical protein
MLKETLELTAGLEWEIREQEKVPLTHHKSLLLHVPLQSISPTPISSPAMNFTKKKCPLETVLTGIDKETIDWT